MRAIRYHRYGPPDVLQLEELPVPAPGPGGVLVRIHATSVNPVDTKIRSGGMRIAVRGLPRVPGLDLSGVIEAVGPGVDGWSAGDEVFASPDHHGDGTSVPCTSILSATSGTESHARSCPGSGRPPAGSKSTWRASSSRPASATLRLTAGVTASSTKVRRVS